MGIAARLAPLLKAEGFRKQGLVFNRSASDGTVHVMSLQLSSYNLGPPRELIPHASTMNLHDTFTVNLGVYLPHLPVWAPPRRTSTGWVSEIACDIRERLGFLGDPPRDRWWAIDVEDEIDEAVDLVASGGLPFLRAFATSTKVFEAFESGHLGNGQRPAAIRFAEAYRLRGDLTAARGVLTRIVDERSIDSTRIALRSRGWDELAELLDSEVIA